MGLRLTGHFATDGHDPPSGPAHRGDGLAIIPAAVWCLKWVRGTGQYGPSGVADTHGPVGRVRAAVWTGRCARAHHPLPCATRYPLEGLRSGRRAPGTPPVADGSSDPPASSVRTRAMFTASQPRVHAGRLEDHGHRSQSRVTQQMTQAATTDGARADVLVAVELATPRRTRESLRWIMARPSADPAAGRRSRAGHRSPPGRRGRSPAPHRCAVSRQMPSRDRSAPCRSAASRIAPSSSMVTPTPPPWPAESSRTSLGSSTVGGPRGRGSGPVPRRPVRCRPRDRCPCATRYARSGTLAPNARAASSSCAMRTTLRSKRDRVRCREIDEVGGMDQELDHATPAAALRNSSSPSWGSLRGAQAVGLSVNTWMTLAPTRRARSAARAQAASDGHVRSHRPPVEAGTGLRPGRRR